MQYRDFKIDGDFHRFTDAGLIVLMEEASHFMGDLEAIENAMMDPEVHEPELDEVWAELKARVSYLDGRVHEVARMLLRQGRGYVAWPDEEEW